MVTLVGGGISPEACGHNLLKYLSLLQPFPCSSFGLCSVFQKSRTCENLQEVLRQCLGCCVCLRGHRKREEEGEGPNRERGSRARKMEDTASTHIGSLFVFSAALTEWPALLPGCERCPGTQRSVRGDTPRFSHMGGKLSTTYY